MLVLSRRPQQSVYIGDDIVLTVVKVRGNKVKLGIKAPDEVPVHRREVYDAIHAWNDQDAPEAEPALSRSPFPPNMSP